MDFPSVDAPNNAFYDLQVQNYWYCIHCNAFVPYSNTTMHKDFHNSYTNRKDGNMSKVLWCDPGHHAFKAGAPGAIHFQGTETDDNGLDHSTDVDACGSHNPFRTDPKHIAKELLSEYPVQDNGNAV